MPNPLTIFLILLVIIVVLCFFSSWYIKDHYILLSGKNEIPPNNSLANGILEVKLVNNNIDLLYRITIQGLTSQITGSHFHSGAHNANGPALLNVPLTPFNENGQIVYKANGSWRLFGSESHIENVLHELQKGNIYYNVTTEKYPQGELRGQVILY